VGLPVETVVEEINAVEVVAAGTPVLRVGKLRRVRARTVAVSLGVAGRMGRAARKIGIGRERPVGN
jgi:hypothetical protein